MKKVVLLGDSIRLIGYGKKVPEILLSGHHAEMEKWKREQALELTKKYRPDLLTTSQAKKATTKKGVKKTPKKKTTK